MLYNNSDLLLEIKETELSYSTPEERLAVRLSYSIRLDTNIYK